MIRNIYLKNTMVYVISHLFSPINRIIPKHEKYVLIYCSNKGLGDNSGALFQYLIENHYNNKYQVICGVKQHKKYQNVALNVKYISRFKAVFEYMRSKYVFYSNGRIPIKPSYKQMVINMHHGIPIKKIGRLSKIASGDQFFFSYVCASSKLFVPIMAGAFGCPVDRVLICGEPKSDNLFKKKKDNRKIIVWAPTFRQSDYLGYNDSTIKEIIPLFKETDYEELNNVLKENGVSLIVKPHPSQNIDNRQQKKYSHFQIVSEKAFSKQGLDLYTFLSQTDALISDYSSVYLNYLMLNRPICFAIPDFEEYQKTRGFVFDNPLDYMPGIHARSKEDVYRFIKDVATGIDYYSDSRVMVSKLINKYQDGKNCKRLLEYAGIRI